MKSSVDQIRARFDRDVERFSNLETGQSAAVDSPLCLDLIAAAAAQTTPQARRVLDVGCGAGNYTLKLLERLPKLDATLVDLSRPMLDRAEERVRAAGAGDVQTAQGDVRTLDLGQGTYDVILAASVLHHLRTDDEWQAVFAAFRRALRPGGSLWIYDLIDSELSGTRELMTQRYGDYLEGLGGPEYRRKVFAYIEEEDTPRPLVWQLDLLRSVGFAAVEVLHKQSCFAAFGALAPATPTGLAVVVP